MTSKNRVGATIQMVYGVDDDLIDWYSNLNGKERHQSLKAALRAGLGLAAPMTAQTHSLGVVAPEQLEALRNELYAEWSAWTRQLVDSLPGYVQEHVERALSTTGAEKPPTVESVPQLTKTEVDQREAKLKKASW